MNKKNKKTKIKRFVALLGVVVILVSALVIPSGAETTKTKADLPFYNFFDCSKIPCCDDIDTRTDTASIVSTNPETGYIKMLADFDGVRSPYVPTSYSYFTLRQVCPDISSGQTYVLNGDAYFEKVSSDLDLDISVFPCIVLKKEGAQDIRWYLGQSLTITWDMLDRTVMLYAGSCYFDEGDLGTYYSYLRLWVNKGEAASFIPHSFYDGIGEAYYNEGKKDGYSSGLAEGESEGYKNGYSSGFADGNKEFIEENLMISKRNVSVTPVYYNQDTYERLYGETYKNLDYNFNGYTFDTRLLDDKYRGVSNIPKGYGLIGYRIDIVPISYGDYYVAGFCDATFTSFNAPQVFYDVSISTLENENAVVERRIDPLTDPDFNYGDAEAVSLNWGYLGIKEGTKITKISITYMLDIPMIEPHKWTETTLLYSFLFSFADQNSYGYQVGYEAGEKYGYSVGVQDVGEEKYAEGKKAGVTEGKNIGYKQGLDEGYDDGYADGSDDGWDVGFAEGKEKGYYEGRADEQENSSFFTLIYSVLDAPVQVISKVLNFEILGVNMSGLASSLVTLAILIVVVKHFV